jgi:hypothetical protein
MTARVAVVLAVALPCILGAHLSALLLGAFAVAIVVAHLLPVIAAVALIGAALILAARIFLTIRQTGFICARSFA